MSALPAGWAATSIAEIARFNPKTVAEDSLTAAFAPMQLLGTRYRDRMRFEERPWGEIKKAYVHFQPNDVIVAKVTPCFENGKAGIAPPLPNSIGAGSSEFCVFRPAQGIDERYLLAWLSTEDFRRRATVAMTGSVGLKRVPKEVFLTEQIPLAPEAEQERIADKLDTVLTRVDAVNTRLVRVAPILKRFRQSVLAAATSGRLTADWRSISTTQSAAIELERYLDLRAKSDKKTPALPDKTHWKMVIPESWVVASVHQFAECLDRLRVPIKREDRQAEKGLYPYYGANGEVSRIDQYIFDDELVLVTEDETFYGREKPIAYRSSGKCWVNNHAHVLRAASKEANDYLCYALMYYDVTPWLSGTTGRAKLTQQALNALPIAVPPANEIIEIVRRVGALFGFADRVEARLQAAKTATERLTPALLAKAFRGELVTQDPNDKPASELLQRLQQQASSTSTKRGRKSSA